VMVIAACRQECRLLAIALLQLEAEHAAIERQRSVEVRNFEMDMADAQSFRCSGIRRGRGTDLADNRVDVERIDAGKADDGVAQAYFAPSEAELLRRTPVADRAQCFFRLWTLKEAYVKAMSVGLSMRLDSFAFSLDPIRIHFPKGSSVEARDWRFATLSTTGEHVLSLAMRHPAGEAARLAPRALAPGEV